MKGLKFKGFRLLISTLLLAAVVGCESGVEGADNSQAKWGYYYFGDEKVPVESYTTADGVQFMLKITPSTDDIMSVKTYAIIGVHTALLGERLDVERRFHNDDYIFVYEDPVCYYSNYRPLQSGTIMMSRSADGKMVDVEADVILYDGTPFRYSAKGLTN